MGDLTKSEIIECILLFVYAFAFSYISWLFFHNPGHTLNAAVSQVDQDGLSLRDSLSKMQCVFNTINPAKNVSEICETNCEFF